LRPYSGATYWIRASASGREPPPNGSLKLSSDLLCAGCGADYSARFQLGFGVSRGPEVM